MLQRVPPHVFGTRITKVCILQYSGLESVLKTPTPNGSCDVVTMSDANF